MTEEMKYFKMIYDWEVNPCRKEQSITFLVGYGKSNGVRVANYLRKEGYNVFFNRLATINFSLFYELI